MKTILLKFAGPLQSYGTSSHFETRYTDYYPSKSAVIGLLAACLGYRRDEAEKLSELSILKFAVRIDQDGRLLRDYHIARSYKDTGAELRTYVTNRYYLEDALFVVALSGMDELIDTLIKAIKFPYFQPFMGRRSLPVPVDFFLGESAEDILDSLRNLPWQAAPWYKKKKGKQGIGEKISLEVYADEEIVEEEKITRSKLRRDIPISFSQKGRQFAFRQEACISIEVLSEIEKDLGVGNAEHDIFFNIGGGVMYLSRVEIDKENRRKIRDLTHLGAYHSWVEDSFVGQISMLERSRKLWRIDSIQGRQYLLILSEEKPSLKALEKYGVEGSGETKSYDSFLASIQEGKKYRFRATLNPVVAKPIEGEKRGKPVPLLTIENQSRFLLERAEKNGFSLNIEDFVIKERKFETLKKKGMKDTPISQVSYEGILSVIDAEQFRKTLCDGIGKKKAYGCGLLTVIPV